MIGIGRLEEYMYLFGNKKDFAIGLGKDVFAYQMVVYIMEQDILQYSFKGQIYPYRWNSFDDIIEWFQKNLKYTL